MVRSLPGADRLLWPLFLPPWRQRWPRPKLHLPKWRWLNLLPRNLHLPKWRWLNLWSPNLHLPKWRLLNLLPLKLHLPKWRLLTLLSPNLRP